MVFKDPKCLIIFLIYYKRGCLVRIFVMKSNKNMQTILFLEQRKNFVYTIFVFIKS